MAKGIEQKRDGVTIMSQWRGILKRSAHDAQEPANNRSLSVIGRLVFGEDRGGPYQLPGSQAPIRIAERLRQACEPI